jgi:peptidoglycan/LPS O-acetylase OafA/YrhL
LRQQGAPPINRQPKIVAIQLLRAMAALTVAIAHFTNGFGRHIDGCLDWLRGLDHAAQCAVALFFVISGCVMVLSSGRLYGQARGPLVFWRRRAVRVVPPYWIATVLFVLISLALGYPVQAGEVMRSLLFVPYRNGTEPALFLPFLWPGWTLFYEMTFYALFGVFVFAGKSWTIALTSLALALMVCAGLLGSPQSIAVISLTRPVLLLFIVGMAMGLLIEGGVTIPGWVRSLCLLAAAIAFAVLPAPASGFSLSFTHLAWAGIPAILLFVSVLGGPLAIPFERAFVLGGDASYAIYLLHVPLAHAWIWVFMRLHSPGGSLGHLLSAVGLLLVLSLIFYRHVERPLTVRLNALLGGARDKA